MHRSALNLQHYVTRAGDEVFAPPFSMDKMDMFVFVLAAKPDALTALLDRELNDPWAQAFASRGLRHHYEPASDWIVVVISEVAELYPTALESLHAASEKGKEAELAKLKSEFWTPNADAYIETMADVSASQRELIVMVPVDDVGPDQAATDALSRAWYVPLVLNDLPPAVTAGRELFGYPKVLAQFNPEFDEKHAGHGGLLLDEHGERTWNKLTIRAHGPVARAPNENAKRRFKLDLVDMLEVSVNDDTTENPPPDAARFASEASKRFEEPPEFLFLRQFRDPEYDQRASYQAAVTGKVTAGAGAISASMKPDDKPQRFSFEFPRFKGNFPRIVDGLGILAGQDDTLVPRAAYTMRDQKLVVTRGVVRWDKS
ncbi:MAG TPA: acetoacetate decarboxylase family protein [Polyangiales bacterium]|nr:acetoacetate decarboxylase family protein [Polyangiales bacterium]